MREVAQAVAQELAAKPDFHDVKPVIVTIGDTQYPGAYAERTDRWQEGMMGVTHGDHKVGDTYNTVFYYLIGKCKGIVDGGLTPNATFMPKPRKTIKGVNRKVCYRIEGHPDDWYIGCHSDPENVRKTSTPHGPMFMLFPWSCGGHVDDGEAKRHRITIQIEEVK